MDMTKQHTATIHSKATDEMYLVGIDVGTTNIRVTAYDVDGTVLLSGTSTIDDPTLAGWERALREAAVHLPNERIVCSVDGTSGTVVLVDENGEQVFRPRMYHESAPKWGDVLRSLDVAEELSSKGVSLSATSPLAKILALRDEHPERFRRVEWILNPATWLLYRLHYTSGPWREVETDWTNALKFGADVLGNDPAWFTPLFDAVDLSTDLLPRIRPPGSPIGHATSDLAMDAGLSDAELYLGMTDGNASALAAGCLEPGDCSVLCSPTSVVKYVAEQVDPHRSLYYHRHPIDGFIAGAAFETGVVLEWFCEHVLGVDQERGLELAQKVPAGEEYRTYLQGNRSPFFDPQMGMTILDLWAESATSPEHTRGRLVRGIATSIALAEYTYLPLIEDHFSTSIDRVQLVSSGSTDGSDPLGWWNVLRASLWNREVVRLEPRTTAGTLIPAALSASIYDDIEEANDSLLRSMGRVPVKDEVREMYAPHRDSFATEWSHLHSLYESFPGRKK